LAAAGAAVDGEMVRFDAQLVEQSLRSAPAEFTIHAPNPDRDVVVGGRNVVLAPAGGPPFVSDLSGGRRAGTLADHRAFTSLVQHFDVIGVTSPVIEPSDVRLEIRHLHSMLTTLLHSDKVPFVYARGRQRMADEIRMLQIRWGLDDLDAFTAVPRCYTNINVNSPRQLDIPMAMAIIDFARLGQAVIVTPFTLAGAMAPVTVAGALVQQHMEALAGITLSQVVRPGAPVLYGAFTSNVDMKSGSPAFGTPEAMKAAFASGQLARHIGVPWRSSGSSSSNSVDAQAGYETMMNTFGALFGGANWIHHSAGWQEGGLTASYEKFIVDIEMCQMIAEMFRPLSVDAGELAVEAIRGVEPGGHHFGTAHTLERYQSAFYQPMVFSRANFEQWTEQGSPTTEQRAAEIVPTVLARCSDPELAEVTRTALFDFVASREAAGGAVPD
jgi:trimethylamine--corrinoid protein Co-methyltransferase